jgi:catechol 2,3-dioxygenase-like lactoylglutathione lyase family enzyme
MKLKHLNLATSDVSGLADFFKRFFAFKCLLERGSGAFVILGNDDDFVLTLMRRKKSDPELYPETFHVGFYVNDRPAVAAKHDELLAAGLSPQDIQEAGRSGRGAHFYCTAPGDILVEVATPPDLQDA